MRIERLRLLAYGAFRGLELDFSKPGLHVVFGKNEAGKSTTLRAITGLLFGIDHQTSDAYVHASKDLSIGALLSGAGEEMSIVRRKGTKNTLLDDAGQPLDESRLVRLLEGVGRDTFKRAFGLDHETLRSGATALLEGKGDLGESLFDASVGGGGEVQRLLAELEGEADRLYAKNAKTRVLNDAIRVFTETKKSIASAERLPAAVIAQEEAIATTKKERDEKTTERNALAAKKALLERASRRIPLEKKRAQLLEARAQLGSIAPHAARLETLRSRQSNYERDVREARERETEASNLSARRVEAARRAGVTDADEALRLDSKKEARIGKLVQERATLEQRLASARLEIAKAERELTRLRDVAAKKPTDTTRLARATRDARALGEAEARHEAASAKLARIRDTLLMRAQSLFARPQAPLDDLLEVRVPSPESLAGLARRADKVDVVVDRLTTRRADLAKEVDRVELSLAENTGALAAPEPADLAKARAEREALFGDAAAYRAAVQRTDAIADRMIREADRVATVAKLRASATELAKQIADVDGEIARTSEDRTAIDAEHAALFAPTEIAVRSIAEMRAWLEKRAQVVLEVERLREQEHDLADDARRIALARTELAEALGLEPLFANKKLAELLDQSTTILTTADRERTAIEEAQKQIAKLEAALDERGVALGADEETLAKTRLALAELVTPIGIEPDASADEVSRAIEALRDFFALADKHDAATAQATRLAKEARLFEEDVTRAVSELAPDLAHLPTLEAAASIAERGARAKKTKDDLDDVEAQLEATPSPLLDDALAAVASDPDRLAQTLEDLDESMTRLDEERLKLTNTLGGLEKSLSDMSGETGAAEQAARAQEALAAVRTHAERYARVKLASVILTREIDRFREENQGPMLNHASKLFARLTLGRYASIRAGFDDADKPTLECVQQDGRALDVESLSEGTRDQLYLSLRLASLAMRAPLPLVLDDILIHFDDDRAKAALEVLCEASKSMQVLFFTHHARMLDLAAELAPCTFHTLENVKLPEAQLPTKIDALP